MTALKQRRPGKPGTDLHTTQAGCLPAIARAGMRLMKAPLYVKAETWPCAGHGIASSGVAGVTRLDCLMTYWIVEFGSEFRVGPYPTRTDADRALPGVSA